MAHLSKARCFEMRFGTALFVPLQAVILTFLGLIACVSGAAQRPLDNLKQIHALSNAEAGHYLPVAFEATVTYYRRYEGTLFVQDGDAGIYVQPSTAYTLAPGDRVLIRGKTEPSFRPFVKEATISVLRHGPVPKSIPATFDELIRAERDCMFVSVRAKVRAADLIYSSDVRSAVLQLVAGGGTIEAVVDSDDTSRLEGLLDAEIEISGAASGKFDGKMQQTGIVIHVSSLDNITVFHRADTSPSSLPVTPMDHILEGYHVQVLSQRVKVHGTITYYQPVLQSCCKMAQRAFGSRPAASLRCRLATWRT